MSNPKSKKTISMKLVYEHAWPVWAFRHSDGKTPTPDNLLFQAYWSEGSQVLVIRRCFEGDEDEPYAIDSAAIDHVATEGEAITIAVKYAELQAEIQTYNAKKTGIDRIRTLDEELGERCGQFFAEWAHKDQKPARFSSPPPMDDGTPASDDLLH